MTKLRLAIEQDPGAVFEIEADLPSGNRMIGTVGPKINGNVCVQVRFSNVTASDEDIRLSTSVLDKALGLKSAWSAVTRNREERAQAIKKRRQFLGGGEG